VPGIARKLETLIEVGLGYIKLGQSATTLSGGEAQRVKLSQELSKRDTGRTLYILDEPTTGLHFHDIEMLLGVLHRLRDARQHRRRHRAQPGRDQDRRLGHRPRPRRRRRRRHSTSATAATPQPSVASVSVIECATVKAVTMRSTSTSASRKPRHRLPAGFPTPAPPAAAATAGTGCGRSRSRCATHPRARYWLAVGRDDQVRQRVRRDVGMPLAQLAPGDLAVAVGVQPDGGFQVAQGDVPLPAQFAALNRKHQIGIAGLVREYRQRTQEKQQ
jgi:hypothetical protein